MSRVLDIFQAIKALSQRENDELALLLADIVPEASLKPETKARVDDLRDAVTDSKRHDLRVFMTEDLWAVVQKARLDCLRFPTAGVHLRLGHFDFWPKSKKWHDMRANVRGVGEAELVSRMKEFYR